MNLPVGMQDVNFEGCDGITGDVGKIVFPEGMQNLDLGGCDELTGTCKAWKDARVGCTMVIHVCVRCFFEAATLRSLFLT